MKNLLTKITNRTLYLLVLLSVGLQFSFGQLMTPPPKDPLLWKITSPNLKQPSYLLGTLHLLCKEDYQLSDEIKKGITESDKVIFEMNLSDPSIVMEMQKAMQSKKKLSEELTPAQFAKLDSLLSPKLGAPLANFDNLNFITIQMLALSNALGCKNPSGVELEVLTFAMLNQKPIAGLESVQQQLEALKMMGTTEEQYQALIENPNFEDQFKTAVNYYLANDLNGSTQLMMDTSYMTEESRYHLLDKRNSQWMKDLPAILANESVFIAVGAGHLVGDNGLIQLLNRAGYTIKPVLSK